MKTQNRYDVIKSGGIAHSTPINYNCKYESEKTKVCPFCKKTFPIISEWLQYKEDGLHFCSYNCRGNYRREKEREEREKIREKFLNGDYDDLGARFKRERKKQCIPITEVTKACGLSNTVYREFEKGNSNLKLIHIKRVANYLQIDINDYLLEREEKNNER